jgi:hypothetical protein
MAEDKKPPEPTEPNTFQEPEIPEASPKEVVIEDDKPETASKRPRTGKDGKKKKKTKVDVSSLISEEKLSQQIYGIHALASIWVPEAAISPEEALALGEAVYDVISMYDLAFLQNVLPWVKLAATLAMVEVPMVVRVRAKRLQGINGQRPTEPPTATAKKTRGKRKSSVVQIGTRVPPEGGKKS